MASCKTTEHFEKECDRFPSMFGLTKKKKKKSSEMFIKGVQYYEINGVFILILEKIKLFFFLFFYNISTIYF